MLMGEMEPEFVLIVFNRLKRRQFNGCVPRETPRINHPCIIARLAMNDLLGQ